MRPGRAHIFHSILRNIVATLRILLLTGATLPGIQSITEQTENPQSGMDQTGTVTYFLRILKHGIVIRPAWQIEEHDPDVSAIRDGDKVVIPYHVQDPPILDTLKRIRERRRRKR